MIRQTFALVIAAALCTAPAFAAMPLITDDTGTQGKGAFQVELGTEASRDEDSVDGVSVRTTGGELSTVLSCGLSDRIDLVAGVPLYWSEAREEGATVSDEDGFGDLSLQLKWRFFETGDKTLSLALKPGITLPTGDEEKGFGNGRVSGEATLIATRAFDSHAVHINLGYARNEYRLENDRNESKNDIWRASLAGEVAVAKRITAVADIGIETNQDREDHTAPAYLLGGLIYSASDTIDLDVGIRGGLNDAETDTSIMAGATMRF